MNNKKKCTFLKYTTIRANVWWIITSFWNTNFTKLHHIMNICIRHIVISLCPAQQLCWKFWWRFLKEKSEIKLNVIKKTTQDVSSCLPEMLFYKQINELQSWFMKHSCKKFFNLLFSLSCGFAILYFYVFFLCFQSYLISQKNLI